MITKKRKYTTKLSPIEIMEVLNAHEEPYYKFSINNRYETAATDDGFKIKSMPASRRGIYRETHIGTISKKDGGSVVEITSKLHKAGPIVVIGLFILFMSGILFPILANPKGGESFADSKFPLLIVFMIVMHLVFYLVFIQLFSWMATKWMVNTIDLEKA